MAYFENKKRSLEATELACFKNEEPADCKARLQGMGWNFPAEAELVDQKWTLPEAKEESSEGDES